MRPQCFPLPSLFKPNDIAKTIKSKIYEGRLAAFGELFASNKADLESVLTVHTALGVDSANQKLDGQKDQLQRIESKLDMMLVFRRLDTPREKDVQKFIEDNGGAKSCIDKDDLLTELVSKSGESVSLSDGAPGRRGRDDIALTRKKLNKELTEDVDELLKKNLQLFERKLDIQEKRLSDTIHESEGRVISVFLSGAHDRIIDEVCSPRNSGMIG